MLDQYLTAPYWQLSFFHNTFQDYVTALALMLILIIICKIFQMVFLKRLERLAKKTATDIDDVLVQIIKKIKPPFYFFLSFWLAVKYLTLTPLTQKVIDVILIIWLTILIIKAMQVLINYVANKKLAKDKQSQTIIQLLSGLSKLTLWSFGALMILSNLGVNVTSLIAGLGIGGIAVALALQNILGDLFSSFAIYLDKPFQVGDYIVVGTDAGTINKIGIKTTRLTAMNGEQLIIPNKELTTARIHNFQQMTTRRVVFSLGVEYGTKQQQLQAIPAMIKDIIKKIKLSEWDRTHFKTFGDSALIFETVYFVQKQDYATYLDVQQEINLRIKEAFDRAKINIAFPTQTIHVVK